eukprot:scaffold91873_cov45-Phaeocystis_antarctica.AAC.1
MATFPLPTMTSLVHQPGQPKVDLAPQILMRPQHDAAGSRKDLTGGRGTVEGHFTFTLVERAAVDPHEARHTAETREARHCAGTVQMMRRDGPTPNTLTP